MRDRTPFHIPYTPRSITGLRSAPIPDPNNSSPSSSPPSQPLKEVIAGRPNRGRSARFFVLPRGTGMVYVQRPSLCAIRPPDRRSDLHQPPPFPPSKFAQLSTNPRPIRVIVSDYGTPRTTLRGTASTPGLRSTWDGGGLFFRCGEEQDRQIGMMGLCWASIEYIYCMHYVLGIHTRNFSPNRDQLRCMLNK